jgi:hypothetical protein
MSGPPCHAQAGSSLAASSQTVVRSADTTLSLVHLVVVSDRPGEPQHSMGDAATPQAKRPQAAGSRPAPAGGHEVPEVAKQLELGTTYHR